MSLIAKAPSKHAKYRARINADPAKKARRQAYQLKYNQAYYEAKKNDPEFKAVRAKWLKDRPGYGASMYRKHYVTRMVERAKKRAKEKGLDFDITVEDIAIPEVCPVLGIPLIIADKDCMSPNSPSLDKIHNELGYVKGNIIVVSLRANIIKGDATIEELRKVSNFYDKLEF